MSVGGSNGAPLLLTSGSQYDNLRVEVYRLTAFIDSPASPPGPTLVSQPLLGINDSKTQSESDNTGHPSFASTGFTPLSPKNPIQVKYKTLTSTTTR